MKKTTLLIPIIFASAIFFCVANFVAASGLSWAQNDWTGGAGQTSWSDSTKYNTASNATTSASGISLSTNTNWYDVSWKYRQSVSVTNNSGTTLTDYQIPIYLNTSGLISASKMKADCGDIRITDESGNILSFWVATAPTADTCNHTATKLWTKLPSLPTAGANLYIYYGNSTATGTSNGNNVFPTFADFTTGSSLPAGWTKTDIGTSGTASVGGGVLTMTNTNGEDVWTNVYGGTHVYNTSTVAGSFIAEALITSQTNSDPWAKTGITVQNTVTASVENGQAFIITTPGNGIAFQYQLSTGDLCVGGCTAPNTQTNSGSVSFPLFLKLIKNNSNQVSGYFSSNGSSWTQRGSAITPWGITDAQYVTLMITPHNVSGISTSTYSFFYTRSYTASEPTVGSPQNEQNPYVSSGNLTSSIFNTETPADFGTLTYTYTTATNTTLAIKVRTSDDASMSGADDFSSCDTITSGTDISSNNCVTDRQRYVQYQVSVSSSDNIYSPILQDISISYTLAPTYTLNYIAGTGGELSGSTTQIIYSGNDGTAVSASANTGYDFVDWSDGVTTTSRTDTNISDNLSVTANFAINTHTLTYSAGIGGSISGSTSQTINYGSDGSAVTAVPSGGYAFSRWSDNNTNNPRTDTNITADLSVSAVFEQTGGGTFVPPSTPKVTAQPIFSNNIISYSVENVYQMAISDSADFSHSSWEPYNENYKTTGKILYIKFRSPDGGESNVYTISPAKKISTTTLSRNYKFNKNLKQGMNNIDVKELQKFLNSKGFLIDTTGIGSPGNESTYFGKLIREALIKFQKANNITPAVGYFGPLTRKIINNP